MSYVMRHGQKIETVTIHDPAPKKKRKYFAAYWTKLPRHWISGLGQSKSANTYRLAHLILLADNEGKRGTGVVTLSSKTTMGMPRSTRRRAAQELVELGLIALVGGGGSTSKALKVRIVPWKDGNATM